jgi:D-glycero-D-manno-heptose 1,7-bisphosphate phosphatase
MNKAIFLDRDGVLNKEIGEYVYNVADFVINDGVPEGLQLLHKAGFKLIVVTNQGGIGRGIYTRKDVLRLHDILQQACGGVLDQLYYSPYHKTVSKSLLSKPNSLMIEKGIAKYRIDVSQSWLIGDAERDMAAAKAVGVKTILLPTSKEHQSTLADYVCVDFTACVELIMKSA